MIYRNDLAPIGDKYAQYMLGYMSLSGLGVEQDPVLASAWYRLAAERGEPEEFVVIRDELLDSWTRWTGHDRTRFTCALRREYSDSSSACVKRAKRFDDLSQVTTGSRLGGPSSAVTIVEPRAGNSLSGDALFHRLQRRMQSHLDHITATLGIDRIEAETLTAGDCPAWNSRYRITSRRPTTR